MTCPKSDVVEIRMLRWMSVNKPRVCIGNECLHKKLRGSPIVDTMWENLFRWYSAPVWRSCKIVVNGVMGTRNRPTRTWMEVIKETIILVNLTEETTLNLTGKKEFL